MRCWKCGQNMPEGLKYCGNCGVHMNRAVHFARWLFSRKGLPVLLIIAALICGGAALGLYLNMDRPEAELSEPPAQEVLDRNTEALRSRLGLTDAQISELEVTGTGSYEGETIVRYAQTWQGVEIYGSSIVTTSGDPDYLAGTWYDLSEAFGEDFDALVAQASEIPEWMTSREADGALLTYNTDSLRPVIYITEENTAVIARCFTLEATCDGEKRELEMVTDIPGEILYDCRELSGIEGYRVVTVKGSMKNPCQLVAQGDTFYAYNEEYNFYAAATIYKTKSDVDRDEYQIIKDGRKQVIGDESLIYSRDSRKWTGGNADMILRAMTSYYNVLDWFYQTFGYRGLDGQGGLSAILVVKDMGSSPAANDSSVMLLVQPDVLKAEEVLAHECTHTMFHVFSGTRGMTKNQTAALNEALADVFGCLYQDAKGDSSWIIGANLDDPDDAKNIPGTFKTMDDYQYDVDEDYPFDWMDKINRKLYKSAGIELVSTGSRYDNAYIITNTMYRIWKNVFRKDSDLFGQALYRSMRYLPADPDFSEFRAAFLYTLEKMYGSKKADAAADEFKKAKIYEEVQDAVVRIAAAVKDRDEVYLLDYCSMDFASIRDTFIYNYYTNPDIYGDGGNVWNCTCMLGEPLSMVFDFASDYEDPDAMPIYVRINDLLYWSGESTGAKLCDGLAFGMTWAEVSGSLDITELDWAPEQRSPEPVYICYGGAEGCALELYFTGSSMDTAILVAVNAIPAG